MSLLTLAQLAFVGATVSLVACVAETAGAGGSDAGAARPDEGSLADNPEDCPDPADVPLDNCDPYGLVCRYHNGACIESYTCVRDTSCDDIDDPTQGCDPWDEWKLTAEEC